MQFLEKSPARWSWQLLQLINAYIIDCRQGALPAPGEQFPRGFSSSGGFTDGIWFCCEVAAKDAEKMKDMCALISYVTSKQDLVFH
jgi:hypothetical protein